MKRGATITGAPPLFIKPYDFSRSVVIKKFKGKKDQTNATKNSKARKKILSSGSVADKVQFFDIIFGGNTAILSFEGKPVSVKRALMKTHKR